MKRSNITEKHCWKWQWAAVSCELLYICCSQLSGYNLQTCQRLIEKLKKFANCKISPPLAKFSLRYLSQNKLSQCVVCTIQCNLSCYTFSFNLDRKLSFVHLPLTLLRYTLLMSCCKVSNFLPRTIWKLKWNSRIIRINDCVFLSLPRFKFTF